MLSAPIGTQESISEDAKNVRSVKNLHAKKALDRLGSVQRDVQAKTLQPEDRIFFCRRDSFSSGHRRTLFHW
jgi:hypothetical protein